MQVRFSGWGNHTQTDLYFQYNIAEQYRLTGDTRYSVNLCGSDHQEELYDLLEQSRSEADPFAFMQANVPGNDFAGMAIMVQIMALAQNAGPFENGWYMLSDLHIVKRAYDAAVQSDAAWADKASVIGFGGMARTDAASLSNDDWLLIAMSYVLQMNMTDYLSVWGISFSSAAKTFVGSQGYPDAPLLYYAMSSLDHCTGLDRPSEPLY